MAGSFSSRRLPFNALAVVHLKVIVDCQHHLVNLLDQFSHRHEDELVVCLLGATVERNTARGALSPVEPDLRKLLT